MKELARAVLLLTVAICSGCASVDKARVAVEKICVEPSTVELLGESDWVIVGNLFGGLGSFDELEIGRAFAAYDDCSSEPSSLPTVDKFRRAMVGWTLIEVSRVDVPLLFSVHGNIAVLVPHDVLDRDAFDVGIPGVWMGYGNLVAASWTPDHVFVVSEVLCDLDDNYRECARQYERGLFDLATGLEHSRDGELKRNPTQIDVITYKRIDERTDSGVAN